MKRIATALLFLVTTGLPANEAWAVALKAHVGLDQPVVLAGQRAHLGILVELEGAKPSATQGAPALPVNMAVVIDRSGSMDEKGKITYAKEAAKRIVDAMRPQDRLAIVEYDDRVSVLAPLGPVSSAVALKRAIDRLAPRGSTNLTAGMLAGVAEVRKAVSTQATTRVILLSDGLANQGVIQPQEIIERVNEARRAGVEISSIGLGLDYNEDLMQAIAEHGRGRYHYVEHPSQLPRVLNDELAVAMTSVTEGLETRFELGSLAKSAKVLGQESERRDSTIVVPQADYYAGEKRLLLLSLDVDPLAVGQHPLGTLVLQFKDTQSGQMQHLDLAFKVEATADTSRVAAAQDKRVAAEVALIEADEEHKEAVRQYEAGNKQAALAQATRTANKLTRQNATLNDLRLKKKVDALRLEEQRMNEADTSVIGRASYLKSSKAILYASTKGTRGGYLLQEGDKGHEVERLQEALATLHLFTGAKDGVFDSELTEAVKALQAQRGLDVDGVAGPRTLSALGLY